MRIMQAELLSAGLLSEEERLENMLHTRLGNRIRDLRVQLLHSGLILQGRAMTYHAKQLAQHAAMELSDYPILANEIEVY
jgi:hypothetical protein